VFGTNGGGQLSPPKSRRESALYEGAEVIDGAAGPDDFDLLLQHRLGLIGRQAIGPHAFQDGRQGRVRDPHSDSFFDDLGEIECAE